MGKLQKPIEKLKEKAEAKRRLGPKEDGKLSRREKETKIAKQILRRWNPTWIITLGSESKSNRMSIKDISDFHRPILRMWERRELINVKMKVTEERWRLSKEEGQRWRSKKRKTLNELGQQRPDRQHWSYLNFTVNE